MNPGVNPASSGQRASPVARFRLATLGELRLDGPDGGDLLAGRRKELALLAFVLRRAPRPVSREELAALLWGERDSAKARQSLRQALLQLRRALGDAFEVTPERAQIVAETVELDITAMERDIAEGRLGEAVARWRGDFLAGAEDAGGESFRAWVEAEREGLRRRLASALDRLIVDALRRGQWDEAVDWAEQWSAVLPLDEQAHRRLVEALKAAGRPDEALARHATFTARLRDELDREPSPSFKALVKELARVVNASRPSGPGAAALLTPDMVGRDAILAELIAAWYEARAGRSTAALIAGDRGLGKTRLCQELVRWVEADDADACVLAARAHEEERDVPCSAAGRLLAGLADAPGLLGAAPSALHAVALIVPGVGDGLAADASPTTPAASNGAARALAVCEVLSAVASEVPVLLVLDDAPLADQATQQILATILQRSPGGVMLVMTGQPDAVAASPLADVLRRSRSVRRLQLQPLGPAETERLVSSMVALDPDDRRRLAERVHTEGAGNPHYITELVFALAEDGTLTLASNGWWQVDAGLAERVLPVPSSLQETVPRRPAPAMEERRRRHPARLIGAAVVALSLAAVVSVWQRRGRAPISAAAVRFTLSIPPTERVKTEVFAPLAFSPDRRSVAYVLYGGRVSTGRGAIYVRSLDALRATPIPGTEGQPFAPFFSPDGRWIAFVDHATSLKKVPAAGGEVVTVVTAPLGVHIFSGTWGPNDVIVVGSDRGLFRVPAGGGALTRLTRVDSASGEVTHGPARFLSDGRTVVFGGLMTRPRPEQWRLGVVSLDTGAYTPFEGHGLVPLGLVDGQLVFGRAGGIIAAVPFDLRRRRPFGEPVSVLEGVLTQPWGNVIASLAADGSLVYMRGNDQRRLVVVDARGERTAGFDQARSYASPRVSPDGRRIALEINSGPAGTTELWVHDVGSEVLTRLPVSAPSFQPAWTPDGRRIIYVAERDGRRELWWVPADGSGGEERLYALPNGETIGAMSISPDGRYAVVVRYGRRAGSDQYSEDLWVLPLGGDQRSQSPTPLLRTAFDERTPSVSPDGRWLAYASDESGAQQFEVYVRPFRSAGGRVQVSSSGGTEPVWSRDGQRLYYRSGGHLMAATVATSGSLAVARRDTVFEDEYRAYHGHTQYDIFPDGKHFVMLQPTGDEQEVVVVLNWAAELRSRVTTARSQRR